MTPHEVSPQRTKGARKETDMRAAMLVVARAVGGLGVLGGAALGGYAWRNLTHSRRAVARAVAAGFREYQHMVSTGALLNYAEGPANGPAVLLLHAQGTAWQSYAPVLPRLARDFHVYVLDVPGHGRSAHDPARYDAIHLGADTAAFINEVVDAPVLLSGHSSGGLIAAQVAATAPQLVRGVLFEDPPFFSTEPARMPQQFNYVDLATPAHEFLQQGGHGDFVSWYMTHNTWIGYFGGARDRIAARAVRRRRRHPAEPLVLWFLPPRINETYAWMHMFDPRFADAFYRMSWQRDFDQVATLRSVRAHSILVHADWRITDTGILQGAMTDDDAERARALMADCSLERVHTGHGFHVEAPDRFVELVHRLRDEVGADRQTAGGPP